MKKIAITQRLIENDKYYELRDCLDVQWGSFFNKMGYLPIVLPSHYDYRAYFDQFKIDGIILSGGNDLGSMSNKVIDKKRDDFERGLIAFAVENQIPLLGICRGMQIVGEYFGLELKEVGNHVAVRHKIVGVANNSYSTCIEKMEEVNSYHNYGFVQTSDDFRVILRAEDGVIEAIEHQSYPILALMWHPERNGEFNQYELDMISTFFNNFNSNKCKHKL